MPRNCALAFLAVVCAASSPAWAQPVAPLGLFEGHSDVGAVLRPGSVQFSAARNTYTIEGSGENMWEGTDEFQFVWKKVTGDVTLAADIAFTGTVGEAHRKGLLMIRQSLDADSPYVDAARHADGLTSIQARDRKGGMTHEVQSSLKAPKRLRIEKHGSSFFVFGTGEGEDLHMAGGGMQLALQEPFYVGLGVCAHDKNAIEKIVFSNVEMTNDPRSAAKRPALYSTIEVVRLAATTDHRAVFVAPERLEAPTWSSDGQAIFFNRGHRIQRVPAAGGKADAVDTGTAIRSIGAKAVSPDGALLAFSDDSRQRGRPSIYVLPLAGGAPRRLTQNSPAAFHGWSPDGQTIVFSAERGGQTDIYTIPAAGGAEKRLTNGQGRSENPEFSPDGAYIYFNSDRRGSTQIWRMRADGTEPEQLTSDGFNNWFPHLSPDGKLMLFLSYDKSVKGQPQNAGATLRMLTLADKSIAVFSNLIGGAGSLDAPCWSPDGKAVAFVSYQIIPQ
jgi:TolB protein